MSQGRSSSFIKSPRKLLGQEFKKKRFKSGEQWEVLRREEGSVIVGRDGVEKSCHLTRRENSAGSSGRADGSACGWGCWGLSAASHAHAGIAVARCCRRRCPQRGAGLELSRSRLAAHSRRRRRGFWSFGHDEIGQSPAPPPPATSICSCFMGQTKKRSGDVD